MGASRNNILPAHGTSFDLNVSMHHSMAPLLGKRKRREETEKDRIAVIQDEDVNDWNALLRQHFEAKFEPLEGVSPSLGKVKHNEDSTSESPFDSDWDGCSEEDDGPIEVVHHSIPPRSKAEIPKEELVSFMVRVAYPSCSRSITNYDMPKRLQSLHLPQKIIRGHR